MCWPGEGECDGSIRRASSRASGLLVLVLELVDEKGAQVTAVRISLGVFPVQRLNAWVNALTS